MTRVLVAGVGNLFLGDDGFGCAVAHVLARRALPEGVEVRDFGTRGIDLAYALAAGWDAAIFVDACPRGGAPGTLYVLDPATAGAAPPLDGHQLRLDEVLPAAERLGELPRTLRVVGCEPATLEGDDGGVGLSAAVSGAIAPAAALVEELLANMRADHA